jgi:hypothetical protein
VAAERQHDAVVAVEENLEGLLGPAPDLLDEPLIGGEAQQAGRDERPPRTPKRSLLMHRMGTIGKHDVEV